MFKIYMKSFLLIIVMIVVCSCSDHATQDLEGQVEPSISETSSTEPSVTEPATQEIAPTSGTWMKTYGGNRDDTAADVLVSEDGGFYIAGATNADFDEEMASDIYLLQTDATGEVLWEQVIEGRGVNSAQAISLTEDGGLLISGVTSSSDTGGADLFLMKLDRDRNEIWSNTYGGPLDEYGAAWPIPEGGYILGGNVVDRDDVVVDDPGVAGYGGFAGRSNIFLARIDSAGNEIWSRSFGRELNVLASSGIRTFDGGFLFLGTIMYYPENDDDIYLLKVDQNGDEVWSRIWEEGNLDAYEVIRTRDGNYLIAGGYAPVGDLDSAKKDFLFIKVDPEGNEIWQSIFGDPEVFDWAYVVTETSDGHFIAAGDLSADLYTWDADVVLVKIDGNGGLIWRRTIETNTHTMLTEILEHPDGGYLIAGSTYRGRNFDILLIKTDAEGNVDE
jgi:hypothetical protein